MNIKEYMKAPCRVFKFNTVDSTNSEAKRILEKQPFLCPIAVVADGQTGGRGRQGKSFYSPDGTGIYMSVAFAVKNNQDITFFTAAVSVAVAEAIESYSDKKTAVKWVNDIYIDGFKVCGILCESVFINVGDESKRYIIAGVGVNLSTENFPKDLQKTAASVGKISCSKNKLIAKIADNIFEVFENPDTDVIFKKYREKSYVIGKNISYLENNVWHIGYAKDIDRSGGLIVETPDGKTVVLSGGEITLRVKHQ